MTAEEALAEVGEINERLMMLQEQIRHATNDPASEPVPQQQYEISEAAARKEWLFEQIERMGKAGT